MHDLPKALAACQYAITLREHVAAFFADDEFGHQYFLDLLKTWLNTLVLEMDEDYFPDEDTFGKDRGGGSQKPKAERKRLFDEAFANNLRLEVVCYFVELEEMVEGVFDIYDQVKKQKRTMMEATVVVTLAMRTANALTANLQIHYPALETAAGLLVVVADHTSASLGTQITKAIKDVRNYFEEGGSFKSQ
ncbi:uncharacterized protein KRP23_3352 [Phytophthora ramorum]|uniref:uncharacterized protein n=1 Tax=Phytophthora ramorum TaxID=164328 RepID=UPI0030A6B2E4|nr:hypothetical protein KRP23_3352 [Phytophthora ramorum]